MIPRSEMKLVLSHLLSMATAVFRKIPLPALGQAGSLGLIFKVRKSERVELARLSELKGSSSPCSLVA